jgi:hypothetical protein
MASQVRVSYSQEVSLTKNMALNKPNQITLFSFINQKFNDLKYTPENHIPTDGFIKFCEDVFMLLEEFKFPSLSTYIFALVKNDFFSNLKKLKESFLKDDKKNSTLQSIVQNEIREKKHKDKNSATNALLWTTRSILFLREFLYQHGINNNDDFVDCAHIAYKVSLKRHHNWILVNFFNYAIKLVSVDKNDVFIKFAYDPDNYFSDPIKFENQIKQELNITIKSMDMLIDSIRLFCMFKKLDL